MSLKKKLKRFMGIRKTKKRIKESGIPVKSLGLDLDMLATLLYNQQEFLDGVEDRLCQ